MTCQEFCIANAETHQRCLKAHQERRLFYLIALINPFRKEHVAIAQYNRSNTCYTKTLLVEWISVLRWNYSRMWKNRQLTELMENIQISIINLICILFFLLPLLSKGPPCWANKELLNLWLYLICLITGNR